MELREAVNRSIAEKEEAYAARPDWGGGVLWQGWRLKVKLGGL